MAKYKDIVGTAIRNNAGNIPTAETGQVFFDSTNVDFKYQFPALADAWRTSAPLNTASWSRVTGGSTTSAWANSGEQTPPQGDAFIKNMETWNGTTWTEANDTSYTHYGGNGSHGVPNNTTGLVFAGYDPAVPGDHGNTEEWNGSSWTELANLNTTRRFPGGNGTTTEACLAYGGLIPSQDYTNTELWNGSSWTEVADINTARYGLNGIGSSTSAAYVGGSIYPGPQPPGSFNELWNGSTWTEATDANQKTHGSGSGVVNTAMLIFGGNPTGYTERWNGSTWTETTDLNEARNSQGGTGAGGSTSALSVGGVPPGGQPNGTGNVEEFVGSQPIGAFSTGPSMNTARYNMSSIGTSTAALAVGGRAPVKSENEEWNGTAWTEKADLNSGRHSMSSSGTTTSGLVSGGEDTAYRNLVEEWNGTSFAVQTAINTTRGEGGGAGASAEAALVYGGASPPGVHALTERWNGSAWTEVADMSQARYQTTSGMGRTYDAALCVGGRTSGTNIVASTEVWNGTSWFEGATLNNGRVMAAGQTGSTTSSIIAGGYTTTAVGNTEDFNGISWQETTDLSTARSGPGGAGADNTAAIVFAGGTPTAVLTSEIWSSTSSTVKVLTD